MAVVNTTRVADNTLSPILISDDGFISAYSGTGEPDSITILVRCKVTAEADNTQKILTNVAWISEMKTRDGIITSDIDSQTTTSPNFNKDNMSEYEGNFADGWYKGQQDDDDFDRVVINPVEEEPNPDLALRKFITQIVDKSGNSRTIDREPTIGDWTLDNGTTVTKTHSKDAITVEKNDIVTYKIRVYNEGNVSGKATKVTDYLPSGLELVENNEINQTYGWTVGNTSDGYTAVSTDYLKNTSIDSYTGRGVPKYVDLQIVCKVTAEEGDNAINLKNIAEITTAENERGTTDRDSEPGNVHATNAYNPTHPTTGRGEQDEPGKSR